ncbi:hypothetical protein RJB83_11060 [Staphylococcus epidermidis]|jgi:hypothetical protein|nr:hypothetical protein [Staphylococcus epidermidis]ELG7156087.1 hypothetical protein [Staphylococcus aureus]HDW3906751.1 hypothetical protein [Escherichia coli]ELL1201007.1 hypothetical protein [Staphylococcus aureus]MDH9287455.1 hypothetical protein [Staphylococcus epidermidis]MDH9530820.1 hypothetical protein [Staphylococcus epidermidis]
MRPVITSIKTQADAIAWIKKAPKGTAFAMNVRTTGYHTAGINRNHKMPIEIPSTIQVTKNTLFRVLHQYGIAGSDLLVACTERHGVYEGIESFEYAIGVLQ